MPSESSRLRELLDEVLLADWSTSTDEEQDSTTNHALNPGERLLTTWAMSSLPRSPYVLEAQSMRKVVGDQSLGIDIELALTHNKDSALSFHGRGDSPEAAYEALLRNLTLKIGELQRAQRLLEFMGVATEIHGAMHDAFDY